MVRARNREGAKTMKCPICIKHRSCTNHRSEKALKQHMRKEHSKEELIEWGKTEFELSEEVVLALRVNWKFKVFEWLWKKWKESDALRIKEEKEAKK